MTMNRREFVGWMGMGAIVTSVVGCNQTDTASEPETTETPEEPEIDQSVRSDGFKPIGTTEQLETEGSLVDKIAGVIVIRDPNGELIAFDRLCTHQGCAVQWESEDQIFDCPCHGSQFSPSGEVLEGPATKSLATYELKTEEDLILFKVS